MIYRIFSLLAVAILTSCQSGGGSTMEGPKEVTKKAMYEQKFSENMTDLPDDFFVMEGTFLPKKLGSNYALFMLPRPLNTYGCLFGPDIKGGVVVTADIFSGKRGRTIPSFGIGSHGLTGIRLYVRAARTGTLLQIIYNETQVIAQAKYDKWATDTWTSMKLYVKSDGKNVEIYGKAWPQSEREGNWLVSYKGELQLEEGQSSFWGIPYSGRDMFFDNLTVDKP